LRSVSGVRWGELRDATGAVADGIPSLLSRIAYGDEDTARIAIDDLGDAICALGFVVGEAAWTPTADAGRHGSTWTMLRPSSSRNPRTWTT
jgi:hypothetical protein